MIEQIDRQAISNGDLKTLTVFIKLWVELALIEVFHQL